MSPSPVTPAKIARVCSRLKEIASALKAGESFEITRLTCLKAVCADHRLASEFALHLAQLASRPSRMKEPISEKEKPLISLSRKVLADYRAHPRVGRSSPLYDLLRQLQEFQSEYDYQRWGPVRMIRSWRLLVIEQSVRCILSPFEAAYWAYQAAKDYAQRYEPGCPYGLVRTSAAPIKDITEFWCKHARQTTL